MKGAHVSSAFEPCACRRTTENRSKPALSAQAVTNDIRTTVPCRGSFAQGGVTMRDCSTNRAGFDRVLMAVAATFLTVSATSALAAQSTGRRRASAAELAIDAAIPRPEPANVPPPTASDFKIDSTASVPDAAKAETPTRQPAEPSRAKAAEPKPAEIATAPRRHRRRDRAPPAATATAPRRRARQGAGEGRSTVAAGRPAGRRQAARHARRQVAALFRPQGRARRRREILRRARLRAALDRRPAS